MGFPPPPDGPAPGPAVPGETAGSFPVQAGFVPGPPVASLCGFAIPSLAFVLAFLLPAFKFPPTLRFPFPSISLKCDLDNPLSVTTGALTFGGGRQPYIAPDPDAE